MTDTRLFQPFSIFIKTVVIKAVALATVTIVATGCSLGPDYERPWTAATEAEGFVHAPAPNTSLDTSLDTETAPVWWRSFGDEATSELVIQALEANTDLKAAAARVLQAGAGLKQTRASLWPEVNGSLNAARQKNSFVLPGAGRVSPISTTYSDSLSVSYQTDLFGGLKRSRQAAWSELLAQEAARETVVHTVISEVVRVRVRLATLDHSVDTARAIRDSWAETLESIERRYKGGLAKSLELRLARENLASAESALVAREQGLEQARLVLDVLLGRRPGTGTVTAGGLAPLPDLDPVPLGLPANLLDRRPDLRQAEMRLSASTARVGIAVADLFPKLTLTGSAGTSSDTLGDLVSSDSLIYNVVAGLVGPIVDGGRRRAAAASARAAAEEAAAIYAGAVLGALREVEDALVRESALRRQLDFLDQRVEEARAADRIARSRYERGVQELLSVLETERRLRSAEEALISARSDLWNARIDLHLALGGDWTPDLPEISREES